MRNLDIYNNSEIVLQRKESKIYKVFIILVLIFALLALLLVTLYKYDRTIKLKSLVKDNKVNLTVSEDNLKLLSNKPILINKKEYQVKIESISEVIYDSNYNEYYQVVLNIDNYELVENDIIDIFIVLGKTNFYNMIKEKIRDGMQQ